MEVALTVRNISATPQTFTAADQKLVDNAGREYSADLAASLGGLVDVNPGNSAPAILMFDVPAGTQPRQYVIVLHAAPDTAGLSRT